MDPAQPQIEQEKELVVWKAMERPFKVRDRQFFTTAMVIAMLVGVILLFAREWMLVATLAAGVFAYYVWSTVPPQEVEYKITTRGVRMHGKLYTWAEMARWWVEEKWGYKLLAVDVPGSFPKRLYLVMIDNENQTTCPLCLEKLSGMGFFNRMAQAEGREVPDLTVTEINLFHINELRYGVYNHKPYNLSWGHHHCNVVTKDSGITGTLKWMKDVLKRNEGRGFKV